MKKRYIVLSVLVVSAAAFYFLTPSLETIVRKVVHKYGSEITGTDVSLKGFSLSLSNGEGRIKEITVANPQNYKTPYVFQLGEIFVKVDIKSLTTDTVIIDKIEIDKPIITYEMLSLTQNNISEIQKNVNKNTNVAVEKAKEPVKTTKKPSKSGKKVLIKNLTVKGGQLNAVTFIQNKENKVTVTLPQIVMTNIGGSQSGENVAAVISKIVSKILTAASQTAMKSNVADLKGLAQDNLNNVVGGVKSRVKSIGIFGK